MWSKIKKIAQLPVNIDKRPGLVIGGVEGQLMIHPFGPEDPDHPEILVLLVDLRDLAQFETDTDFLRLSDDGITDAMAFAI